MSPRRRAGVHPVLPPVHPAADPGRLDGQPAAVRRRLGRAGLRAARRRGAEPGPGAGRRRRPQPRGRVEFEHVVVPLRAGQAAHRRPVAGGRAGPDGGDRRADRRRQDHAGQPAHAVLRARRRPHHPRRRRHRHACPATTCASEIGMVLQDTWLFGGTIRDNIAYGHPDATDEEILAAAQATYVDRFVHTLPRRLRHRHRRGGQQRQRRREAADHHRAGVPGRPVAADPRRGDQLGRHPHRGAGAAGDGGAAVATAPAS